MNEHVHHYILSATGITVTGVCKHCGAEREFDNAMAETTYGGTMTTAKAQAMAAAKKRRGITLEPKSPLDWVR